MAAYTLKEAWQLGWRLRVKCNTVDGRKEAHRNKGLDCHSVHELDMKTLVWTRGEYLDPRDAKAAPMSGLRQPRNPCLLGGAERTCRCGGEG
jgi:hypothetical protein